MKKTIKIKNIELKSTSKGEPLVTMTFSPVEEGKDMIFNQIITQGFQIQIVNELLEQLGTNLNIEFKSYTQYGDLINNIFNIIKEQAYELTVCEDNQNGFHTYHIQPVQ